MSELQSVIDDLGMRLGRSVVLDDSEQRVAAHSVQHGPMDALRRNSILQKATPPDIVAWMRQFGIYEAVGTARTPENLDFDILPRLCAPVRYRGRLLGFLWVIEDHEKRSAEDERMLMRAADHVALLLYEEELNRRLISSSIAQLLSPSDSLRQAAARQINEDALFPAHATSYVVTVLQPVDPSTNVSGPIRESLWDLSWHRGSDDLLRLARPNHGIYLIAGQDDEVTLELAEAGRSALSTRLAAADVPCAVVAAIGEPQERLSEVLTSYRQARLATRAARVIPSFGQVVRWRDLGAFRALAQLGSEDDIGSLIDPRLTTLLQNGDATLLETLETYLDLAGDVKATASALHVHRGTLYYRLDKIQKLADVNLTLGLDRLALHLAFKLARLNGLYPAPARPL